MSEEFTPEQVRQVLDLELDGYHGHRTVRAYLLALLRDVWNDGEGLDGKRPFGNSSWDYDIKVPMLKAGIIGGNLDQDGDVFDLDDEAAGKLILAAIAALGAPREADAEPQPAKVIIVTEAAVTELSKEFWIKAKAIEADPFGSGQLAAADIGRAIAYRDASRKLRALAADADADARAEAGEDWNAPGRERIGDDL